MKTTVESTVPTAYQRQSISAFGLPVKSNGNGTLSIEYTFNTKKEAINYMLSIVEALANDETSLKEMKREVRKHGRIYYDAACLTIK